VLSQSDTPIESAIAAFAEFGVEAAYFVPTRTGMGKSIVDAHASIRSYFLAKGLHDFSEQPQGTGAKRFIDVELLYPDRTEIRRMSLYRPKSKTGDPRLWVSRLGTYASAGNLLALLANDDGRIALVNCSDLNLMATRQQSGSPLRELLESLGVDSVANELLGKLRSIAARGFIPSLRAGDTGVGYTLESLLGITANSSREPDYRGIELKAGRLDSSSRSRNRRNLFSQKPDWGRSRYRSAAELLEAFADVDSETGLRRFYCTVSSRPNPRGLFFAVDVESGVVEHRLLSPNKAGDPVVLWAADSLIGALALKHRETFWIGAEVRRDEADREHFQFVSVLHTKAPLLGNFLPLIDAGTITMDYTIRERPSGSPKDHGYLFKISPSKLHLLFPDPQSVDLRESPEMVLSREIR
jgi:hypothetical protein